jgi:hypothetical protein
MADPEAFEHATETLDTDEYESRVSFEDYDVDREDFSQLIAYCVGYMRRSHGLTDISHVDKELVFTRSEQQ